MRLLGTLMTTSALALLAGPALADLTADEVLADQIRQMEAYGLTVETTGQSRSGNTLAVDGLKASAELPEGAFDMTIGGVDFVEQGDGTVMIVYPPTMPISVSGVSKDGEDFAMSMNVASKAMQAVVSGSPDQIRYDFSAEEASVGDLAFTAPAEAAKIDMDMSFVMKGLAGMMELGGGEIRDYTANFTMAAMTGLVSGTDPEGSEGTFTIKIDVADVAADYAGAFAAQDLMTSFAEGIKAGNRTTGTMKHGPVTYDISGNGVDGAFQMALAAASGDFNFAMGESGLDYGGTTRGITAAVSGDMVPFPSVQVSIEESGGRIAMPLVPAEDPQNFGLRMTLVGLSIDPAIWSMFDPGEVLPRDPATLVIDVDGEGILTEDVFDPEFAEKEMTAPPGQVNALNVNELKLTLAGAELTGDADFTFNNEMGMPIPSGVANLMLVGGNGLLDKLVSLGFVPEDQAMGARMMLGLFARPGDGEDTLVSTIEVKEDGSVMANGQRIK